MYTLRSTRKLIRVASSIVAISAMFLSGLLTISYAQAGTTGTLSGVAVDAATHAPLVGAQVTVSGPSALESTTTDKNGHFTFASLPPDTYTVRLAATGYSQSDLHDVDVVADNQIDVTLSASSTTGSQ